MVMAVKSGPLKWPTKLSLTLTLTSLGQRTQWATISNKFTGVHSLGSSIVSSGRRLAPGVDRMWALGIVGLCDPS